MHVNLSMSQFVLQAMGVIYANHVLNMMEICTQEVIQTNAQSA